MPRTMKAADGGKRYPLNMRTTKETRARLEQAAMASGRSLAQEVEARLERSFAEEDQFGGREILDKALLFAQAFREGGAAVARFEGLNDLSPAGWMQNSACYFAAITTAAKALAALPPLELPRESNGQHRYLAVSVRRVIKEEEVDPSTSEELEQLLQQYGGPSKSIRAKKGQDDGNS